MEQVKMNQVFEDLFGELNLMDEGAYLPNSPITKGEEIIGDCPPYTKKIYALMKHYAREIGQVSLDMNFTATNSDSWNKMAKKYDKCVDIHKMLRLMLWISIDEHLNYWACEWNLGVRDDWKIVRFKGGTDIFGALLGQDNQ
jgi:nucleosome binding factor SPN SPT16 subunit